MGSKYNMTNEGILALHKTRFELGFKVFWTVEWLTFRGYCVKISFWSTALSLKSIGPIRLTIMHPYTKQIYMISTIQRRFQL